MKKYIHTFLLSLIILYSFSIIAAVKNTRTSSVYNDIYLAVWAAEPGDTLLIAKGIYTNDWIPMDHKSLTIKGNYADDFSVQYQVDTVETIVNAGQYYAAWAASCTSYLEYVHLNAGEHGLIAVSSVVTCKNCFVEFNTNSSYGAGILAYNHSKVILDNSHVWNNIVTGTSGKGGGMYISNSCELVMTAHANVLKNEAAYGGGMYVNNAEVNMLQFSEIYGCKAGKSGGAINLSSSVLNVKNSSSVGVEGVIITNTSEQYGGGIYGYKSTITFTNNAALVCGIAGLNGGGMYAKDCNVYFYDTTIGGGNSADSHGGGVYLYGGNAIINNAEFKGNFAGGSGAALRLYREAFCEINDSVFENNTAGNDGGGLAVSGVSTAIVNQSSINYNTAGDDGGGIYLEESSYLRMEKFKINNNLADNMISDNGYGGGICMFDSKTDLIAGNFGSSILTNNAENGGGIYAGNNSLLTYVPSSGGIVVNFNSLNIVYNGATENGGGIYLQGNSSLVSTGKIYFTSNGAENGGGIYICDSSSAKMIDSDILNKPTIYQNGARDNGGGIMLSNASEFVGHKCVISGNIAQNNGGGIYAISSTSSLSATYSHPTSHPQCSLNNNVALKAGGAYFGSSGSLLDLDSVEVTNNLALAFCGGLEAYNSIINARNTIIAGNTGTNCGGAAAVLWGKVNLSFCTITDNATNAFSSGTIAAGMFTLTNCILWGNIGNTFYGPGIKNIGYSDIEGGFTGEGNIDVDPEFDTYYSLMASSPCIDTGIFTDVTYDCIGNTRPYGDNVDLGAYEFVPEPGFYLSFIIYQLLFISRWRKLK